MEPFIYFCADRVRRGGDSDTPSRRWPEPSQTLFGGFLTSWTSYFFLGLYKSSKTSVVVDFSQGECCRSQGWICEAMDSSMTLSIGPNGGAFPSRQFFKIC